MQLPKELVDDAHQWKKWWSMRWTIASAAFSTAALAWPSIPVDWAASFPHWVKTVLGSGALLSAVLAGVARIVKQPSKDPS